MALLGARAVALLKLIEKMGFHDIKKVESDAFYIDVAFRRASEKADQLRGKYISDDKISRSKQIESMKVKTVKNVLEDKLLYILKSFPDIDDLHEFYRELIKAMLDYRELKKSLGAVNWAQRQISEFGVVMNRKINASSNPAVMNKHRREYYGRCVSFLRQIRRNLKYLENARVVMQKFPMVKTGLDTVAIVGFPNVGKTTLLYKLTGSRAEINSYAFTTKGINVGYLNKKKKAKTKEISAAIKERKSRSKIQLLDTPGTLNREDKMNAIEKVAYYALTLLAQKAVYVFDLTEPFPLEDQIELYKNVQKVGIPVITYISKTDLLSKEAYEEFAARVKAATTLEEVKAFIE